MDIESFYSKLPSFGQNLACTLEGYRIRRQRYSREFFKVLYAFEQRSHWSSAQIEEYRDSLLRAYIRHCAETVPYFGRKFREWGIAPESIRGIDDLQAIPVLSKAEFVANGAEMISRAVRNTDCITCHTSGTTGGGLHFLMTRAANWAQWAAWWRYRRWHGIDLDTKCCYFGGRSVVPITQNAGRFWRYDWARRQVLFSGYHISEQTLRLYADELRRQRAPWICGYPSLLVLIASYITDTGYDLGYIPRWVTTLAENLLPLQRNVITKAFGVTPRQHYGMAEGVANISECEDGRLHVDEDFSAVEFVSDGRIENCRVIGTSFLNFASAFLRYEVGDRASLAAEARCPCGKPGRLIDVLDGRQEDYVIRQDGSQVGRLDHVFKDLVNIREAQVCQETPGEIEIRVVRGAAYGASDETRLMAEMIKRLGKETKIGIKYCEALPRGSGGKLRFVVSNLQKGKIAVPGEGVGTNIH